MRKRIILGWLCGVMLALVLLVAVALYALLATETGSRWLLERAAMLAGEQTTVAFTHGRGRLLDHIELTGLSIDAAGSHIQLKRLTLDWSPRTLLDGSVLINALHLDGLEVTPPPAPETEPAPVPAITLPALPLPGTIRELAVRGITLHNPGQDLVIDELGLAASWDREVIALTNVHLSAGEQRLSADAKLRSGAHAHHELTAHWQGVLDARPASVTLVASGPFDRLALNLDVDGPAKAHIAGNVQPLATPLAMVLNGSIQAPALGGDIALDDIEIAVSGDLQDLSLTAATRVGPTGSGDYAVTVTAALASNAAPQTATFDWRAVPQSANLATVAGHGRIVLDNDLITVAHTSTAPLASELTGTVATGANAPVLDLQLTWQDFALPFGAGQDIIARTGSVTARGTPDALALVIAGAFEGTPAGPVALNGRAQLGSNRLNIETLSADVLKGVVDVDGTFTWRGEPSAEFRFSGSDIDLGRFQADSPSRVSFAGAGTFTGADNGPRATLELTSIGGELRGHAISGAARLHTGPDAIVVDSARFAAGANRLAFHGTWADALDGEFDLALTDLGALDERLSGSLTGQGAIGGAPLRPRIDAELTGRALRFDRYTAADLDADIDIDLARSEASQATLNFSGLQLDGDALGDVTLRGSGTAAEHHLRLSFDGPQASFETAADGRLIGDKWVGEVAELDANSDLAGAWNLSSPSTVSVSGDDAAIGDTCLVSGTARVCITAARLAAGAKARIAMSGVPLALADFYLPRTLRLRGRLNGEVDLIHDGSILTGSGSLAVADGRIEREMVGTAAPEQVAIESLTGDFTLSADTFAAEVHANVERWLEFDGAVSSGRTADAPLAGEVAARATELAWLAEFAPELAGTDGELELHTTLGGSRSAPHGRGRLSLTRGTLALPDLGLAVERINATFDASSETIVFDAALGAGSGELRATGKASKALAGTHWDYNVDLGGQDFPLVRLPEAEADVTPDLKLTGDAEGLHVSGTLNVPRVAIDVKRLPSSAVSVSDDEVIIAGDNAGDDEPASRGFMTDAVSGDVAIRLGDAISVNGFGLSSKLSGGVDWKKRRGEPLGRASGKINIDDGVFKAYGQHLQIENGRIVFAGPIDNPNLNLRAYRPGLAVKAGVNVRGSVRDPKISLFSEPSQSDGDTLSYIVTGHALDDTSSGDSSILTQAALSLGAEESAAVTNQIRGKFGLDEFTVNTGSTVQDTSLVAGKNLSPKLSVRTDYNPFEQLWTFFLNYKLTSKWSVEAESGERQGADLLYSVEGEDLLETLSPFSK